MFSIGISEVLLVAIVGCLVTDPKKLPSLIRAAGAYYRKFDEIRTEILSSFREVCSNGSSSESTASAVKGEKHVIGNDGAVYEAYEVSDLIHMSKEGSNPMMSGNLVNALREKEKKGIDGPASKICENDE